LKSLKRKLRNRENSIFGIKIRAARTADTIVNKRQGAGQANAFSLDELCQFSSIIVTCFLTHYLESAMDGRNVPKRGISSARE